MRSYNFGCDFNILVACVYPRSDFTFAENVCTEEALGELSMARLLRPVTAVVYNLL